MTIRHQRRVAKALTLAFVLALGLLCIPWTTVNNAQAQTTDDAEDDGLAGSIYLQEKFDEGYTNQVGQVDPHFSRAGSAGEIQAASVSAITSDDFNRANLDPSRWTLVNPLNDGAIRMVGAGTGDAHLELILPEGVSHDPWEANRALRVMQAIANTDFDIELKFDSVPSEKFQIQGLMVEQDADNWMRLEIHFDGENLRIFTATTTDGTTVGRQSRVVTPGTVAYLRVIRSGNGWTTSYSLDGTNYTDSVVFTHEITVNRVGPYVANHNPSGNAPAYTARLDYIFDVNNPIAPEDGGNPADTLPPLQHSINQPATDETSLTVTLNTDEPATGQVDYGETTAYGQTVNSGASQYNQSFVLTGLEEGKTYHMRIRSRDAGGRTTNSEDIEFVFEPDNSLGPKIDLWYGESQSYGQLGNPQPWVNIVGNVSDGNGVVALSYSLNGRTPVKMKIGPDGRRLHGAGDFNVDLATSALDDGPNTVELTAIDSLGNTTTKSVTVNYQAGQEWPIPYSIDWNDVGSDADLLSKVQVIDGKWTVEGSGARTAEPGYDRFLGLGDLKWNDYEVTVPVTINSLPESGQYGLGVVMRWNGHTDSPHVCGQPKCGWLPLGSISWFVGYYDPVLMQTKAERLEIYGNNGDIVDSQNRSMEVGLTYWVKARVETSADGGTYSMKLWQDGQIEPAEWDISGQETLQDPQRGSVLLIAHRADVTFGNVQIVRVGSGQNFSPVANDDAATVAPSGTKIIHVLANDTDAGGLLDPTTVTITTQPAHGSLTVDSVTGTVTYQHNGNGATSDTFRYQVTDDEGAVSNNATVSVTISDSAPSGFISDDFNTCSLNPFWSEFTPLGEGSIQVAGGGSGDAHLVLALPAGTTHNVWDTAEVDGTTVPFNSALRVMQPTPNSNFEIEVKFENEPTDGRNDQGILIEQDEENYLRFDVYHTGTALRIFAGSTIDGSNKPELNQTVAVSTTNYLRVTRSGNTWSFAHSPDGDAWTTAASFSQALNVSSAGVFVANTGGLAYTAVVDYAFNTASPIEDEDGERNTLTFSVENGIIQPEPAAEQYACGAEVSLRAIADAGYRFDSWGGDLSGKNNPSTLTISGPASVTANFVEEGTDTTPPVITLRGANPLAVEAGTSFSDPGATATDDVDGDLTAQIVVGGDTVDANTLGNYVVTYDVADSSGNDAPQVARTVRVEDTTPPVITLNGSTTVQLQVGDTYTDPGATAIDSFEGNLTSGIVTGGDVVDTAQPGTYRVTYNVSDASGNSAEEKVRTIRVGAGGGTSVYLPYVVGGR